MTTQPVLDEVPFLSVDLVAAARRSDELRGVPRDELERDVADYRRFLALLRAHPGLPAAPTKRIDRIWHLHMLHPVAYHADCMRLFGEILDHDGGFGSEPEEAPVLAELFKQTAALWLHSFGTPYLGEAKACTRNCVSRCTRRCKTLGMKCHAA